MSKIQNNACVLIHRSPSCVAHVCFFNILDLFLQVAIYSIHRVDLSSVQSASFEVIQFIAQRISLSAKMDFSVLLPSIDLLSIETPTSLEPDYLRGAIENSIESDTSSKIQDFDNIIEQAMAAQNLAYQNEILDSGFLLPIETMSSRVKSLLAELPKLQLPKEPLKHFTVFPNLPLEVRIISY